MLKTLVISAASAGYAEKSRPRRYALAGRFAGENTVAAVLEGCGDGARFAAESAARKIKAFLAGFGDGALKNDPDLLLLRLKESIAADLKNKLSAANCPAFSAAAVAPDCWFAIQTGGGSWAAAAENGRLFRSAGGKAGGHFFSEERPAAVFLGSAEGLGNESLQDMFYSAALYSFALDGLGPAEKTLEGFLQRLPEDLSLAAIIDTEKTRGLPGAGVTKSPAEKKESRQKTAEQPGESRDGFLIRDGVLVKYTGAGPEAAIPEGVTAVGEGAFRNCRSLERAVLPDGVTRIGFGAFNGCHSLSMVSLPDGLREIEGSAFRWCAALEEVALPESVTRIGFGAFTGCSALKKIVIRGNAGQNVRQGLPKNAAVEMRKSETARIYSLLRLLGALDAPENARRK